MKKERDKTYLIKKDARYEQSIHYETCLAKSGKLKGFVKGNLQNLAAGIPRCEVVNKAGLIMNGKLGGWACPLINHSIQEVSVSMVIDGKWWCWDKFGHLLPL